MKTVTTAIITTLVAALLASAAYAQPWRWSGNQRNTPGWQLMTPAERTEHQSKLSSFTDYNACKEYVDQHHKLMEERSKEKGVPLRAFKRNPCDMMKEHGVLK